MNMPGFNAEAGMCHAINYYRNNVIEVSGQSGTIEAALMAQGVLECGGTCPDGGLLCKGTKSCQCCKTGCSVDKDGNAFCTHDPVTLTGGGSGFTSRGGRLGGFAARQQWWPDGTQGKTSLTFG